MIFKYIALVCGGIGPNVWDKEIEVSGENMNIKKALDEVEKQIGGIGDVVSIEQIE